MSDTCFSRYTFSVGDAEHGDPMGLPSIPPEFPKRCLVGLCGYARSGKDTAAEVLIKAGFTRVAFADALKLDVLIALQRSAQIVNRADTGQSTGGIQVTTGLFSSPATKERFRPLLVEYGRAMRALSPGYWIDRMAADVIGIDRVVVTDVRYQNEVSWVQENGGVVIYLDRPGIGPANQEEHDSFSQIKQDFTVVNDGTIEELHQAVEQIVRDYT